MTPALTIARPEGPIYRVARRPDPWAWPDWAYADEDGTFGSRFDDPRAEYRVLYASSQRESAFVETLARYRVDLQVAAEFTTTAWEGRRRRNIHVLSLAAAPDGNGPERPASSLTVRATELRVGLHQPLRAAGIPGQAAKPALAVERSPTGPSAASREAVLGGAARRSCPPRSAA